MSRSTKILFTAGFSCLVLAFLLHAPVETDSLDPDPIVAYNPSPSRSTSLSHVAPRPTRTIPVQYRSRVIPTPMAARPRSPRPLWAKMSRKRSSEELLERALLELALELKAQKENTQKEAELDIVAMEEIAEDVVPDPVVQEDPLSHLPAIRRRPDIEASGTAFKAFGYRPFKSDWSDYVFRQFRTPGLS